MKQWKCEKCEQVQSGEDLVCVRCELGKPKWYLRQASARRRAYIMCNIEPESELGFRISEACELSFIAGQESLADRLIVSLGLNIGR